MPSSASATSDIFTLSLHDALPIFQYSNAIQIDSRFAQAHYQLSQTYLKLGDTNRAFQELDRTVELAPDNYRARTDLSNLLVTVRNRSEEHTSELQSRGHLVCRLLLPPPPTSSLFPYTTLFRSSSIPMPFRSTPALPRRTTSSARLISSSATPTAPSRN